MDDIRPALPKDSKRFVTLFRQTVRNRAGAIVSPVDTIAS
ncbi:hypothetical protein MnTg04_00010 [bacterium MnTg04]|nr:hypothetical protein MnTg04_00010 [bacterium MnTg04]